MVSIVVTGCVVHTDREVDEVPLDGAVEVIVADLDAGDLRVEVGGDAAAHVERTWSWAGERPEVEARLEDGTLTIDVRCHSALFARCSVDHVVFLPAPAEVIAATGSGDVAVSDVLAAELSTGSGDVELNGVEGDVQVSTGSGDVLGRGLAAADVWAFTGSGDVDLGLDVAPTHVGVETGSGDVRLALPSGRYDVRTETGSGDVSMDNVDDDRGAGATVDVETGSGDITITGR